MKKLNNKGFTLIEIVIVIVIIAILAAMLVPSLTQWIDKSKIKTFTSACGTIKTAAASIVAENYALDSDVTGITANDMDAISADVGKDVTLETLGDGDYCIVSYDYPNDTIKITDGKYTGESVKGAAWTVTKNS